MADGPVIQRAGQRALKAGITLGKTLELVRRFRARDDATPLVLMGYYNPIYIYGVDRFLEDALAVGLDGMIVVDLPPEEDDELCRPALDAGLSFVRLAAPTTDDARLPAVLTNTSGFVYYISITGITGAAGAAAAATQAAVERLRRHTATADRRRLRHQDPGAGGGDRPRRRCRGRGLGPDRGDRGGPRCGRRGDSCLPRQRAGAGARAGERACAGRGRRRHRELARSVLAAQGEWPLPPARHPARPVGEVQRVRADDLPPRAGEQSPGLPALRPSHAARRGEAPGRCSSTTTATRPSSCPP